MIGIEGRRARPGPSEPRRTLRTALTVAGLALLPAALLATALAHWTSNRTLAWDFHHELYPQAKLMLAGDDPYPPAGHDPATGTNLVWPPIAAFLVAPLTLFSPDSADVAMALTGPALLAGALWLLQVRDWRVYGVFALWPPVFIEPGLSHLTPVIVFLTAVAWRQRDSGAQGGLAVGLAVAIKVFVWPLGFWLASVGRWRSILTAAIASASTLVLLVPYQAPEEYVSLLGRVAGTFDQDGYSVYGLVVQAGGPDVLGRALALAVTAGLLWGTWRYRSFTLAVAAALAASPVVWLDYYALAAVPLALVRPRLSAVWFVPLATAGLEGAGLGIGDTLGSLRVLVAYAIVLGVAFRAERSHRSPPVTSADARGSPGRRPLTDGVNDI